MTAQKIELPEKEIADLCRRYQVRELAVFGSFARGDFRPDSDIDLLVVKSGVKNRRRLAQDIYMNLAGVGVGVDIVVATPEDVEYLKDRVGSVIRPAMREGREIYAA